MTGPPKFWRKFPKQIKVAISSHWLAHRGEAHWFSIKVLREEALLLPTGEFFSGVPCIERGREIAPRSLLLKSSQRSYFLLQQLPGEINHALTLIQTINLLENTRTVSHRWWLAQTVWLWISSAIKLSNWTCRRHYLQRSNASLFCTRV